MNRFKLETRYPDAMWCDATLHDMMNRWTILLTWWNSNCGVTGVLLQWYILWTSHTDNWVKPNKLKITPYKNMHFNSVVIIILADPNVFQMVLLLWNQFCAKKLVGAFVYFPLGGELGGSKDGHFWNKKMYKTRQVDSL